MLIVSYYYIMNTEYCDKSVLKAFYYITSVYITNKLCQERHFELIPFLSGILERYIVKELLRINNLERTKKFGYVKTF